MHARTGQLGPAQSRQPLAALHYQLLVLGPAVGTCNEGGHLGILLVPVPHAPLVASWAAVGAGHRVGHGQHPDRLSPCAPHAKTHGPST